MHPLGALYLYTFSSTKEKETLRISGDLARLKEYIGHINDHPNLHLITHEPLHKIRGGLWSCFVTVETVRVPAPK